MKLSLRSVFVSAVLLALSLQQLSAQVSGYLFTQSNSAYTEITGGTVLGTATDNVW